MEEESMLKKGWKKLPLKVKLIIIGVITGVVFFVMFLIVMITPLMELGIIDISGIGSISGGPSGGGFTSVTSTTSFWWPIGSAETTTSGGITYASGNPQSLDITSYFEAQEDFRTNAHNGLDIGNAGNGPGVINIIASKDGKVIYPTSSSLTSFNDNGYYGNSDGGGFGNYVMIEHNDNTVTVYAHMARNSITVLAGDYVKQGQVIGKMGNSGSSTGTHLHFEVRDNGSRVDPLNYIDPSNPRPKYSSGSYISGNDNKQSVCLTLKDRGIPNNGVAAIMTNMFKESNFNPESLGDNGTSYGLCQWHLGRYDALRNAFPDSYHTIGSQIDFLLYELNNKHTELYKSLLDSNNSVYDSTYYFCIDFERPADTENRCKKRAVDSSEFEMYVNNGCR